MNQQQILAQALIQDPTTSPTALVPRNRPSQVTPEQRAATWKSMPGIVDRAVSDALRFALPKAMTTPQNEMVQQWRSGQSNPLLDTLEAVSPGAAVSRPASALASGVARKATADALKGYPTRISTRNPTAKAPTADPKADQLSIGGTEFKGSSVYEHNTDLVRSYPGFKNTQGLSTDDAAEKYIDQSTGNLLFLHDSVPAEIRERSKLWYDGANNIANQWSERYGVSRPQVAGMMAALSPQKDWFQNASLAERMLDVMTKQYSTRMTSEMEAAQKRIASLASGKNAELFAKIQGKRLDELTDPVERAIWVRLYDEAHNPRQYRIITPEGDLGDFVTKKNGARAGAGWGSLVEISKAVRAFDSGGDRAQLSDIMGERHKIRNFYNNIEVPNAPFGDVTIDTHAVAAAHLRPHAGGTLEVAHNFKNAIDKRDALAGALAAKGSAKDGVQGTYGLNVDPVRRAAEARGLLPREMQSVTWEAVRSLFPDTFKNAKNNAKLNAIWSEFDAGNISLDEARKAIIQAAGGIDAPSWAGRGSPVLNAGRGSSYLE